VLGSQGILVKCTAAIFFPTVDCFCVSLLRTQIRTPRHAWERTLSIKWKKKWIGQMVIAIALPGFNDLRRAVTPISLLIDHFLYWYFTFREKRKKIYRLEVWIFCKMHHRIPSFLALRLSVRSQMVLRGLSFVKTLVTFGFIYATDPLLQIWLRSFASVDSPSIFLTIKLINCCKTC